jgi:hypothetical protein
MFTFDVTKTGPEPLFGDKVDLPLLLGPVPSGQDGQLPAR